jgi:predicted metal-dependent HD superfamily phosphohydrolase
MEGQYDVIYNSVYHHIVAKLQQELPSRFTYHSLYHTMDVLEQCGVIATHEGVKSEEDLFLLKIAALFHDTGFIYSYTGHEARSCELCRQELAPLGFSEEQFKKICGMIMATKIPQSPKNLLEEIICDADLDYLGRDDFDIISNNLFNEFSSVGFVTDYDDWMRKQISFLETHRYFTRYANETRNPKKAEQLEKIKSYFTK